MNRKPKNDWDPADLFEDDLDERYLEEEEEALFDLLEEPPAPQEQEAPAEAPAEEPSGEDFAALCRQEGLDADMMETLIKEGFFHTALEDARREAQSRMVQTLGEHTAERDRFDTRIRNGMGVTQALQMARQEQLEQKIRQLEQQLKNKGSAVGSLQSRADPAWTLE